MLSRDCRSGIGNNCTGSSPPVRFLRLFPSLFPSLRARAPPAFPIFHAARLRSQTRNQENTIRCISAFSLSLSLFPFLSSTLTVCSPSLICRASGRKSAPRKLKLPSPRSFYGLQIIRVCCVYTLVHLPLFPIEKKNERK